ncbi:hypothetical protein AVEN_244100-1 [Araneus ventricosus]|uniref:Uncharacterized protein n=1 Tax=Araneus ventricosus TaxID=182803 RepID=A0A4Y2IHN1_ARAVE|nr:hypothetical protein AVEN_244100-1 [Araneus ventricosus]
MQWMKLSQVRMRYKLAIVFLVAIYLGITVISNKLEVSSFYWASEFQDLDRIFHILSNKSEASGNTTRSDVMRSFSATAYSLNVEVILIEPSILFDLLTNQQQELLLKRGYNVTDFRYVPGIVTFGFLNKYRKCITRSHRKNFAYDDRPIDFNEELVSRFSAMESVIRDIIIAPFNTT